MTKYDKIIKVIFMKKVELLAPAGNLECLKVAVDNGADAIYLGGQSFSARAYADNFNEDEIIEGIRYAHIRGCKVYVTINTMVYDDEIDSLLEYVDFLYLNEVDALIVADFGLINLFKQRYPMLQCSSRFHYRCSNLHTLHSIEFQPLLQIPHLRYQLVQELHS